MAEDEKNTNAEKRDRKRLDRQGMVTKAIEEAGDVIEQLAHTLIDGAERTQATERSTITISIAYNPGGSRSKGSFDVSGKASIPAKGFSHETVTHEREDGSTQLSMYEENI